jgi:formamidopyrimidine-DNA glycosylase
MFLLTIGETEMPELPEVETVIQGLRSQPILQSTIQQIVVSWERTVLPLLPREFLDRVLGSSIQRIQRRGKHLMMALERDGQEAGWICGHLRMTGKFFVCLADEPLLPHERLRLVLANGQSLIFCDPRKFGRLSWLEDPAALDQRLGVEPLGPDFSADCLQHQLRASSRMLKPLLLDQSVIAGLGNIYVDESLWLARLHPLRRADTLVRHEVEALHEAILCALRRGLEWGGTSLGQGLAYFQKVNGESGLHQEALQVFRRTGKPCPRCATPIQRLVVAQRGTHICPHCQEAPAEKAPQ